jgi:hypothetical protein
MKLLQSLTHLVILVHVVSFQKFEHQSIRRLRSSQKSTQHFSSIKSWIKEAFNQRMAVLPLTLISLIGFPLVENQNNIAHAAPSLTQSLNIAKAENKDISLYFGVGCFWHVQHEFVETERRVLGRTDTELTVKTYCDLLQDCTSL